MIDTITEADLACQMLECRTRGGPTLLSAIRWGAIPYLIVFSAFVLLTTISAVLLIMLPHNVIYRNMLPFVLGWGTAIVCRDFAYLFSRKRNWRFIERVTDWCKVQRIASGEDVDSQRVV